MVDRNTPPKKQSLPFVWRALLLSRSLGWLGSLALISSGVAWAQTDVFVDNLGGSPTAAPPLVPAAAKSATPAPASAIAKPEKAPTVTPAPVAQPQPATGSAGRGDSRA
ncbi:MAG: hypothetical protein HC910_20835, partial [Spirulinaceae cyanobacterium SM2_1_0]|nr:hypothetical protein [Spirulinaceae cyanobacterium SM2_1_0]